MISLELIPGTVWGNVCLLVSFAFFSCAFAEVFVKLVFRAYNRTLRARNIRERGWPPCHLDADGDFRPTDKDSETGR